MAGMSVRMAIVGCGGRGREFAKGVAADGRCDVVALVDPARDRAEAVAKEFGFRASLYESLDAMLLAEKPEAVCLALWTRLHLPAIERCLAAGVGTILCEKPMAETWPKCRRIGELAQRTGATITFCHQRRFAPGNRYLRALLREGVFGEIQRLDLYSPPHLLDCGTHTVDQALSFLGEVPGKWVLGGCDLSKTVNYFDVPAEGTAVGVVVFQNGVRAQFQFGGPDLDLWGGVRLHGTKGFFEAFWDGEIQRAVVYDDPKWKPEPPEGDPREDVMRHVVADALDAPAKGEEPELSWQKALRAAEILFGLYESMRRRERVELPLTNVNDNPMFELLGLEQH
ncbi:MAG: Gfo/Idh/MocA family oxidoreductase [Armatimonadetes bacterium]|nr:Gfo/Idh/MocA family oxidoreductase [Armatimonadota bacterium]